MLIQRVSKSGSILDKSTAGGCLDFNLCFMLYLYKYCNNYSEDIVKIRKGSCALKVLSDHFK